VSIIHPGLAIRDFDMAPVFERREHHEEIGRAVFNTSDIPDVSYALVFVIEPGWPPLFHHDRSARFGNQLLRGLVRANQRNIGIMRPRVHGQQGLHGGYECAVGVRWDDPLLFQMRLENVFFESPPNRAVTGAIDDVQFHDLVLQQPQCPACAALRRLGTSQGNQLGFLLAVENPGNGWRRSWLAAQHSLDAFFPQLFAHPVNHRCAGLQGLDDLVVAPSFAGFRDVRLLQDPRLHQALRRAAPFPDQRCKLFTIVVAQPHNIFLYDNFLRRHDRLCRSGRGESESSNPFKMVEANH
jgi:hypothetical protein